MWINTTKGFRKDGYIQEQKFEMVINKKKSERYGSILGPLGGKKSEFWFLFSEFEHFPQDSNFNLKILTLFSELCL